MQDANEGNAFDGEQMLLEEEKKVSWTSCANLEGCYIETVEVEPGSVQVPSCADEKSCQAVSYLVQCTCGAEDECCDIIRAANVLASLRECFKLPQRSTKSASLVFLENGFLPY